MKVMTFNFPDQGLEAQIHIEELGEQFYNISVSPVTKEKPSNREEQEALLRLCPPTKFTYFNEVEKQQIIENLHTCEISSDFYDNLLGEVVKVYHARDAGHSEYDRLHLIPNWTSEPEDDGINILYRWDPYYSNWVMQYCDACITKVFLLEDDFVAPLEHK